MKFGRRVQDLRKQLSLTQRELAERLAVNAISVLLVDS